MVSSDGVRAFVSNCWIYCRVAPKQLSLFGEEELERLGQKPCYRFAVETDFDGSIARISFVVLSGAIPTSIWQIPLDGATTRIASLWGDLEPGVELPPPAVGLPKPEHVRKSANEP